MILVTGFISTAYAAETFTVNADTGEVVFPLWVERGETVTFSISGKWRMWDQWGTVDYRGHTDFEKINDYGYLGALIGRIEGSQNFLIEDGQVYVSPVSGRLIMFANRGNYRHLEASGSIQVTVAGGKVITEQEAERLAGWNMLALDTAKGVRYMTRSEREVVIFLNKARTNPARFSQQYLSAVRNQNSYAEECYQELLASPPLPLLSPSKALSLAARAHATDMGEAGQTGHVGTDGSSLSTRINRFGSWGSSVAENCSYGYRDPLEIVLQLLIDEEVPSRGHRRNILNAQLRFVGVAIEPHKGYDYNCVMDFAGSIEDR